MPAEAARPFPTEKADSDQPKQASPADPKARWDAFDVNAAARSTPAAPWRLSHLLYAVAGAAVLLKLWDAIGLPLIVLLFIGFLVL